jgi:hypothetical protein
MSAILMTAESGILLLVEFLTGGIIISKVVQACVLQPEMVKMYCNLLNRIVVLFKAVVVVMFDST